VSFSGAIDKRAFLAGAGSLFLSTLSARATDILQHSEALYCSCIKRADGSYGAVLLNEQAALIKDIDLPDRGHAITFDQKSIIVNIRYGCRKPGHVDKPTFYIWSLLGL